MWVFRASEWLNALSHTSYLYGFSPLWNVNSAVLNEVSSLCKSFATNSTFKRFLSWMTSSVCWQHLPHSVHLYLPLWIFICSYRPVWDEKRFSHQVHEYKFSPVCLFLWMFNCPLVVNRLSHNVHEYGLGLSSCGRSVKSLLSYSLLTSNDLSPVQYQH